MISWLNDNSGAVQAVSAAISVIVTVILVVVTYRYAKYTRDYAAYTKELVSAAAGQLEASRNVAEATMRPVISLWIKPVQYAEGRWIACYKNIGNGPAINITFQLPNIVTASSRVGMSPQDPISEDLAFDLPPSTTATTISSEYEDASRTKWKTELTLIPVDQSYTNGSTVLTKLG